MDFIYFSEKYGINLLLGCCIIGSVNSPKRSVLRARPEPRVGEEEASAAEALMASQPMIDAKTQRFEGEGSPATLLIRHLPEAIPQDTLSRLFSSYGASSVRPCSSGRYYESFSIPPLWFPLIIILVFSHYLLVFVFSP